MREVDNFGYFGRCTDNVPAGDRSVMLGRPLEFVEAGRVEFDAEGSVSSGEGLFSFPLPDGVVGVDRDNLKRRRG